MNIVFWMIAGLLLVVALGGVIVFWYRKKKAGADANKEAGNELEEIRSEFRTTERELRRNAGRFNLHDLPRFMILGRNDSGRTTLLKDLGLQRHESRRRKSGAVHWWIYDQGVVFEPDSRLILDESGEAAAGRGWSTVLSLLYNLEPDRPLDGIILTVPLEDLLPAHPGATEREAVRENALRTAAVYHQLFKDIQRMTGLRLPVYLLISCCDRMPEFAAFMNSLEPKLRRDAFGWSSPYSLDTILTPMQTDELLNDMIHRVRELQLQHFAEHDPSGDMDAFFELPDRLELLREPLHIYLDTIFRESVYYEPALFRGLYMIGRFEDPRDRNTFIAFQERLFFERIFVEQNLARPIVRSWISRNRRVRILQWATLTFTVLVTVGLFLDFFAIRKATENFRPAIEKIGYDLSEYDKRHKQRTLTDARLGNFAANMYTSIANLPDDNMRFVAIPYSWLGTLDAQLQDVLEAGYRKLVLRAFRNTLLRRSIQISDCFHKNFAGEYCKELPKAPRQLTERDAGPLPLETEAMKTIEEPLSDSGENKTQETPAAEDSEESKESVASQQGGEPTPAPAQPSVDDPFENQEAELKQVGEYRQFLRYIETVGQYEQNVLRYNNLLEYGLADVEEIRELAYYLDFPLEVQRLELSGIYLAALRNVEAPEQKISGDAFIFRIEPIERRLAEYQYNPIGRTGEQIAKLRTELQKVDRVAFRNDKVFWASLDVNPDDLDDEVRSIVQQNLRPTFYEETRDRAVELQKAVYEVHFHRGVYESFHELQTALERAPAGRAASPAALRADLKRTLARADEDLRHLNQAWITSNPFEVDRRFQAAMQSLEVTRQGAIIVQTVREDHGRFAADARRRFAKYATDLTGPIFARDGNDPDGEIRQPLQYGPCMEVFRDVLLDEAGTETELSLRFDPAGTVVWNKKVLEEGITDYNKERETLPDRFNACPAPSLTLLQLFGNEDLRANLFVRLRQAITFVPFPAGPRGLLTEQDLKVEAKSLEDVTDPLGQVQALLQGSSVDQGTPLLYDFLSRQGGRAMRSLQEIVVTEDPYGASPGDYERWDGRNGLTFQIYGLHGEADIEKYLTAQRERLHTLGGYALPYVRVLDNGVARFGKAPMVQYGTYNEYLYWKQLTGELEQYQKNKARTSIDELERFILFQMDTVTANNCCSALDCRNLYQVPVSDFFRYRLYRLKQNIKNRCQRLYLN